MLKFYAGGGFIFILMILGIIFKGKEKKQQKNKQKKFKELDYECYWGQYVEIDSE